MARVNWISTACLRTVVVKSVDIRSGNGSGDEVTWTDEDVVHYRIYASPSSLIGLMRHDFLPMNHGAEVGLFWRFASNHITCSNDIADVG